MSIPPPAFSPEEQADRDHQLIVDRLKELTKNWGSTDQNVCWLFADGDPKKHDKQGYARLSIFETSVLVHPMAYCYLARELGLEIPPEEQSLRTANGYFPREKYQEYCRAHRFVIAHTCRNHHCFRHIRLITRSENSKENRELGMCPKGEKNSKCTIPDATIRVFGDAFRQLQADFQLRHGPPPSKPSAADPPRKTRVSPYDAYMAKFNKERLQLAKRLEQQFGIGHRYIHLSILSGRIRSDASGIHNPDALPKASLAFEDLHARLIQNKGENALMRSLGEALRLEREKDVRLIPTKFPGLDFGSCWVSTRAPIDAGYCQFRFGGCTNCRLYRVQYIVHHPGVNIDDDLIRHSLACSALDDKYPGELFGRRCYNPEHLKSGTYKDNARDRFDAGHSQASLSHDQVFKILDMVAAEFPYRFIAQVVIGKPDSSMICMIVKKRTYASWVDEWTAGNSDKSLQSKHSSTNTYEGVFFNRNRWIAMAAKRGIAPNGKEEMRPYTISFDTQMEALAMRNALQLALRGRDAHLYPLPEGVAPVQVPAYFLQRMQAEKTLVEGVEVPEEKAGRLDRRRTGWKGAKRARVEESDE